MPAPEKQSPSIKKPGGKRPGAGRPKGSPNAITRDVRAAIKGAFDAVGGQDYLERIARSDEKTFCALLSKIVPTQSENLNLTLGLFGNKPITELTPEEINTELAERRTRLEEFELTEKAMLRLLELTRSKDAHVARYAVELLPRYREALPDTYARAHTEFSGTMKRGLVNGQG